jgi:hypothetical protein
MKAMARSIRVKLCDRCSLAAPILYRIKHEKRENERVREPESEGVRE